MKTCTQGAERKGANQKAQRASIRKRFYIMKTRTSKLAAIFTSVALAATMLASCGGSQIRSQLSPERTAQEQEAHSSS